MLFPTAALALLGLTTALPATSKSKREDTWGGSVSLGPTKSTIIKAETTLIPGLPPTTQNGELFLWPGMSNGTGDLIQTTLEQWPTSSGGNAWCGATTAQWCVRASLFGSFGQLDSDSAAVSADDQVKIVYTRVGTPDASLNTIWTQNVTNAQTGAYLSSFSHSSGPMTGYGTGTECDDSCSGSISEQKYLNTVITLESGDSTFGNTIAKAGSATYTNLSSNADYSVWTISEILLPAMVSS